MGTTLTETLATIVLIGLMGVAMVSGIQAIQRAYNKVVRKANEQVLLSTAVIEMRDMIRNSRDYIKKGDIPRFFSKEGYWFQFGNSEDGITVSYYSDKEDSSLKSTLALIPVHQGKVPDSNVKFDKVIIENNGKVHITGLQAGDTTLIKASGEKANDYYVTVIVKENGGD